VPAEPPAASTGGWVDGALGWAALAGVLAAVLARGGDHPAAATALALGLLALGAVRLGLDARRPLGRPTRALAPAALATALVLAWGTLQATPGLAPTGLGHPAWATVDAPAAIALDPIAARHELVRLAAVLVAFWLVARAAEARRRAHRFVVAIALFTGAYALYALAAHALGANPLVDPVGRTAGPLTGSFLNRNTYATYAVFGLLANLAAWLARPEHHRTVAAVGARARLRAVLEALTGGGWVFWLGAAACAASVVVAQSRAGTAVAVVGVVVLAASAHRDRAAALIVTLGVTAATVAGLALLGAGGLGAGGLGERLARAPSEDIRWPVYAALWTAIGERPWLGQGLGGFTDGFRAHVPPAAANLEWGSAHQGYLELVYELGVPAAVLFYGAVALVLVRIARGLRRRRRDRALPALALAAAAAGGLHAAVDFSFALPAVATLFAALLAIGYAQSFTSAERRAP
jgi:O-antigen ligase